jgi:hypothetical protein
MENTAEPLSQKSRPVLKIPARLGPCKVGFAVTSSARGSVWLDAQLVIHGVQDPLPGAKITAERRLVVGFWGMGAVSLNRSAMIDYGGTGTDTRKLPKTPFPRHLNFNSSERSSEQRYCTVGSSRLKNREVIGAVNIDAPEEARGQHTVEFLF